MSLTKNLSPFISMMVAGVIGFQSLAMANADFPQIESSDASPPPARVFRPIETAEQRKARVDKAAAQIKEVMESFGVVAADIGMQGKKLRDSSKDFKIEDAMRIAKGTLPETIQEIHAGIVQVDNLLAQLRELRSSTKGDLLLEYSVVTQLATAGLTNLTMHLHLSKDHVAHFQFLATAGLMWANIINNYQKRDKLAKISPEAMKASLIELASDLTRNGFDESQIGKASNFITSLSNSLDNDKAKILGTDAIDGFNELGPALQYVIATTALIYSGMLFIPQTQKLAESRIKMFKSIAAKLKNSANKVEDLAGKAAGVKTKVAAHTGVGITVGGVDVGDILFGMSSTKGIAMVDKVEAQLIQARNDLIASLNQKK